MLAGAGPLLFFPVFTALISFNTANELTGLKSKVSRETVCSLISRILGCCAYLIMVFNTGPLDVLLSTTVSCATILRGSVVFVTYEFRQVYHSII